MTSPGKWINNYNRYFYSHYNTNEAENSVADFQQCRQMNHMLF